MVTTEQQALDGLYSRRGRNVSPPRVGDPSKSIEMISFIYGFPDPESLPAGTVADAAVKALQENGKWALQYGATMGVKSLVEVLIEKLERDQGITASPENVMITAGGSQAVGLIVDLFVDWDDTVLMEAPTWMGFIWALKNVGAKQMAVPMQDDGMDMDALRDTLESLKADGVTPKMIYIIPNFQNPTGISMSLEKRKQLIELAHEFGTIIFEDDAYFDLRFSGEKIPSIYSLDPYGLTIYTATFSKTMGAGMRLGWLVAPKEVMDHLGVLKVDGGTNIFGSYVAAEWIPANLPDHLVTLREIYHQRKLIMLGCARKAHARRNDVDRSGRRFFRLGHARRTESTRWRCCPGRGRWASSICRGVAATPKAAERTRSGFPIRSRATTRSNPESRFWRRWSRASFWRRRRSSCLSRTIPRTYTVDRGPERSNPDPQPGGQRSRTRL